MTTPPSFQVQSQKSSFGQTQGKKINNIHELPPIPGLTGVKTQEEKKEVCDESSLGKIENKKINQISPSFIQVGQYTPVSLPIPQDESPSDLSARIGQIQPPQETRTKSHSQLLKEDMNRRPEPPQRPPNINTTNIAALQKNDERKKQEQLNSKLQDKVSEMHKQVDEIRGSMGHIQGEIPPEKSYQKDLLPLLTEKQINIADLSQFKLEAKNFVLIYENDFYETYEQIIGYFKTILKNKFGEGSINFNFERDKLLIWCRFENKVRTSDYVNSFVIGNKGCLVYTVEKANLGKVDLYITGYTEVKKEKALPKNFPTDITFEQIQRLLKNAKLDEKEFRLLLDAANGGDHHSVSYLVEEVARSMNMIIGEDSSYEFSDVRCLWRELEDNELLSNLMYYCKSFMDTQLAILFAENNVEKSESRDKLIARCAELKKKLGLVPFMQHCKKLVQGRFTEEYNIFKEHLDNDPNVAPIRGNKIIYYPTCQVFPRTIKNLFSFEYPVTFLETLPDEKDESRMKVDKFLDDITLGRKDYRDYKLEKFGYGITGWTNDRKGYFLLGEGGTGGSNGKTTEISMIAACIGKHFKQGNNSLIFYKKGAIKRDDQAPTPAKYAIKGARFVFIDEAGRDEIINSREFKKLTGNGKDTKRGMQKEEEEYTPTFKIFVATNGMPEMDADDGGSWSRPQIYPYECKYVLQEEMKRLESENKDNPTAMNRYRPMDINFKDDIVKDIKALDYFYTLLALGAKRYRNNPTPIPSCVTEALNQYKCDNDVAELFLKSCTIRSGDGELSSDLFASYKIWHKSQFPDSSVGEDGPSFGKTMTNKLGSSCQKSSGRGKGSRFYKNITILDNWQTSDRKAANVQAISQFSFENLRAQLTQQGLNPQQIQIIIDGCYK